MCMLYNYVVFFLASSQGLCGVWYTLFAHSLLPKKSQELGYYCILYFFMNSAMLECSTVRLYVAHWMISMAEAYQGFQAALSSALLLPHIFQYNMIGSELDWVHVLNSLPNVMKKFTDILMHAQMVCTKPFLLCKGPGDEAIFRGLGTTYVMSRRLMRMASNI